MSIEENININNEIFNKNRSMNEELNPIVIQLIEFGYDKIYSRRVFHYFHPDDLEEALNYMGIDNGIIQHRFIKDKRNINNKLCYIFGESEEIHLKELNFIQWIRRSNHSIKTESNSSKSSTYNHNNKRSINHNNNINELKNIDIKITNNIVNENTNTNNINKKLDEVVNNSIQNNIDNLKGNNNNSNSNPEINNNRKNLKDNKENEINILNNLTNTKKNIYNEKNITKSKNSNINTNVGNIESNPFKKINEAINNTLNNLKNISNKINMQINNENNINEIKKNEKDSSSEKSDSFSFGKINKRINSNLSFSSSSDREELNYDMKKSININSLKNPFRKREDKHNLKNESEIEELEEEEKKECPICGDEFMVNRKNKVKNCSHAFCDECWYDFLSIKIKENKLPSIKCLDYNCDSKLSDEFIINILKSDKDLIKKYKKYKIELEIINNPNKKLCPFPNCDSFLELKDLKEKYVICENNHTFCFLCLKKPHGENPCEEKMDKSIIEYALNNFVKKCPNCSIIIEKNNGCNHITCSKCQYQWCWLCNQKYEIGHYSQGKCKGFQFFKPKNEYEIKLMMEGKINADELSESQRQSDFDDDDYLEDSDDFSDGFFPHFMMRNIMNRSLDSESEQSQGIGHGIYINIPPPKIKYNPYGEIGIIKKILFTIGFIFFGNVYFIYRKYKFSKGLHNILMLIIDLINIVAFFFPFIILNTISLIIILIFEGFEEFILILYLNKQPYISEVILILISFIFGIFCPFFTKWKEIVHNTYILSKNYESLITFFPCFIMLFVVFFPLILFYNFIFMIILLIKEGSFNSFLIELDYNFEKTFEFRILEL